METKTNAVCVNSGTAGLHLALEALNISSDDYVAVPSLTFTATAEITRYLGAHPLFIDSEQNSGNMEAGYLTMAIQNAENNGKRVKAVIPVHLAGHPCDIKKIRAAINSATKNKVAIVEDAAHALPSRTSEGMAGTWGEIGVFSFYANKTITTGEGGMVITKNDKIANRVRTMRIHGVDREIWNRYSSRATGFSWQYDIIEAGYKYNMPDTAASLGRVQLSRAWELFRSRVKLAENYSNGLEGTRKLTLPEHVQGHAWHHYIIHTQTEELRNKVYLELYKCGIGSSVHFIPLHKMTHWKKKYRLKNDDFPIAGDLGSRRLSLPMWPGLKKRAQQKIIRIIRNTLND